MADKGPSFPFRIVGGSTVTSTFSEEELTKISESVLQIVQTGVEERISRTIGSIATRLVFVSDYDLFSAMAERLKQDIEDQEPRIREVAVTLEVPEDGKVVIGIRYKVREEEEIEQTLEVVR